MNPIRWLTAALERLLDSHPDGCDCGKYTCPERDPLLVREYRYHPVFVLPHQRDYIRHAKPGDIPDQPAGGAE